MSAEKKRQINPGVQGSKHPNSLLKEEDVIDILKMLKQGYRTKTLAMLYNISLPNISHIRRNKSWVHINRDDYSIIPYVQKEKPIKKTTYKLKESQVREILDLLEVDKKHEYIASIYNISPQTISNIKCGKTWRQIPRSEKLNKVRYNPYRRGVKLTTEDVIEIRRLLKLGEKHEYLAALYGVLATTISSIHTRRTWRHLP